MEEKEKRFVDYVVGDLIKRTEFEKLSPVQKPYIELPWKPNILYPFTKIKGSKKPIVGYYGFILNNYGISFDEKIVSIIWDKYRNTIVNDYGRYGR
jgi:hypothetical protein